jgi:hypothetical protein
MTAASTVPARPQPARDDCASPQTANIPRLLAVLVLLWLPALVGRQAVGDAVNLYPLVFSANPYFHPEHALLLYLWSPLVALSACVLLLSPGLLLVAAYGAARNAGQWILHGLAVSIVLISAVTAALQSAMGSPPLGGGFVALVIACSAAAAAAMWRRQRREQIVWPLSAPGSWTMIASMAVVSWALLVILAPKFYWENFNADGFESFEPARLLLRQATPYWPAAAGHMSSYPGFTSSLFPYPTSWFVRLFGEHEVCARLPFLLYLAALYGGLCALIEWGAPRAGRLFHRPVIWLTLAVYVSVVAYSSTYDPYSADIALPAAEDTLLMALFVGVILAFAQGAGRWMAFLALLTYLTEANGGMLVALWAFSAWLIWRPRPARQLKIAVAVLAGCVALSLITPRLLPVFGLPPPGGEHGFTALLYKFNFLQLGHWQRFVYVALPAGVLPCLALLIWKRQDALSRAITLTTAFYFGLFYIQAFTTLHYFVPAMILPIAVMWRIGVPMPAARQPYLAAAAAAVCALAAFWISFPENHAPHTHARSVGATIDNRLAGFADLDPSLYRRSELLWKLFPSDWEPYVPSKAYGGSALVWSYYAYRSRDDSTRAINYILQPADAAPPENGALVEKQDGAAVYVLDQALWKAHQLAQPPTPAGNALYAIPRWMLFGIYGYERSGGPAVLDILEFLKAHGLDIKQRLKDAGVKR